MNYRPRSTVFFIYAARYSPTLEHNPRTDSSSATATIPRIFPTPNLRADQWTLSTSPANSPIQFAIELPDHRYGHGELINRHWPLNKLTPMYTFDNGAKGLIGVMTPARFSSKASKWLRGWFRFYSPSHKRLLMTQRRAGLSVKRIVHPAAFEKKTDESPDADICTTDDFCCFGDGNLRMNISCGWYMFTNRFRRRTNFISKATHTPPLHAEAKLSELIRGGMIWYAFISGWMSIER